MTAQVPPHTLRIKRKRTQDPLQALLVENAAKRKRAGTYVFRLAGTFEDAPGQDQILLREDNAREETRVFRLAKRKRDNEVDAMAENSDTARSLADMLHSYLEIQRQTEEAREPEPAKIQEPSGSTLGTYETSSAEIEDYVYDIYYREAVAQDGDSLPAGPRVGLFVFDSDDELAFDELSGPGETDDEDSNAEDFYRNDYPDEEDEHSDEEPSELRQDRVNWSESEDEYDWSEDDL